MLLESSASSGKKTSSGAITAKPTAVYGVILINDGVACTASILDGGSGGTEKFIVSDGGTTAGNMTSLIFDKPVLCGTDCYLTLSSSSAAYAYVLYQQYGA